MAKQQNSIPLISSKDISHCEGHLNVHIIGGGPAGLLTAILIAETNRSENEPPITIYEKSWEVIGGTVKRRSGEDCREQVVVTFNDPVLKGILSKETFKALFPGQLDRPSSYNLPISIVEDRLFARLRSFGNRVTCRGGEMTRECLRKLAKLEGVLIIGADGERSTVRKAFWAEDVFRDYHGFGTQCHMKRDYALGMPYRVPDASPGLDPSIADDSRVLTTSQSILQGNFSMETGQGWVDLRLSKAEFELLQRNEAAFTSSEATNIEVPQEERALLETAEHALKAFGLCPTPPWSEMRPSVYALDQSRVPTFVNWERVGRFSCVVLVGDAGAKAHYWGGHGAEVALQGAASAAALAVELYSGWLTERDEKKYHPIVYRHNTDVCELIVKEQDRRNNSYFEKLETVPVSDAQHGADLAQFRKSLQFAEGKLRAVHRKARLSFCPDVERIMRRVRSLPPSLVSAMVFSPSWPEERLQLPLPLPAISKALKNAQRADGFNPLKMTEGFSPLKMAEGLSKVKITDAFNPFKKMICPSAAVATRRGETKTLAELTGPFMGDGRTPLPAGKGVGATCSVIAPQKP